MPLYKMTVAYDGTRFAGFQRQTSNVDSTAGQGHHRAAAAAAAAVVSNKRPHWNSSATGKRKRIAAAITIQECLEDAFIRYVQDERQITTTLEEMCLKLAGRTDRGVHARGQVIAVRLPLTLAATLSSSSSSSSSECNNNLDDSRKDNADNNNNRNNNSAAAAAAATATELVSTNNNKHSSYSESYLIGMEEIRKGINSRLPIDICVVQVQELDASQESFEPRHDVQRKVYSYTIKYRRKPESNNNNNNNQNLAAALARLGPDLVRDPFDSTCLWLVPWALDDRGLADLCQKLQGHHNFRAFVHKKNRNERDHVLTVDRIDVKFLSTKTTTSSSSVNDNDATTSSTARNTVPDSSSSTVSSSDAPIVVARLEFEAKGFRRSMIRNLVGFCVDVCRGYEPAVQLNWEDIWNGDDRAANAINAAAASGLCLERVIY